MQLHTMHSPWSGSAVARIVHRRQAPTGPDVPPATARGRR